jgi:hypothetical protein
MVEPPGKPRIAGVFEIHDGVFVAVEQPRLEELRSSMGHSRVSKFRIRVNSPRDEAAEKGSRRCPIKTMVVVQHSFQHVQDKENLPACLNVKGNASFLCRLFRQSGLQALLQ